MILIKNERDEWHVAEQKNKWILGMRRFLSKNYDRKLGSSELSHNVTKKRFFFLIKITLKSSLARFNINAFLLNKLKITLHVNVRVRSAVITIKLDYFR